MEFSILSISITDWVGYVAMILLFLSFAMKDLIKVRIINSAGCIFFVAYGFMLATAWPIIISNSAIFCMHLYHLFVNKRT